jgi:hypothetical protein
MISKFSNIRLIHAILSILIHGDCNTSHIYIIESNIYFIIMFINISFYIYQSLVGPVMIDAELGRENHGSIPATAIGRVVKNQKIILHININIVLYYFTCSIVHY